MRIVIAAVLTLATGCFITTEGDPSAPAAEGTLSLSAAADTSTFTALEIHWDRVDGTYGESGVDVLEAPWYFPMEYRTPLGFGRSDAHTYRLSVWFSNGTWDAPTTAPPQGSAHATQDVEIPKCTDGCPSVRDVELTLAP